VSLQPPAAHDMSAALFGYPYPAFSQNTLPPPSASACGMAWLLASVTRSGPASGATATSLVAASSPASVCVGDAWLQATMGNAIHAHLTPKELMSSLGPSARCAAMVIYCGSGPRGRCAVVPERATRSHTLRQQPMRSWALTPARLDRHLMTSERSQHVTAFVHGAFAPVRDARVVAALGVTHVARGLIRGAENEPRFRV